MNALTASILLLITAAWPRALAATPTHANSHSPLARLQHRARQHCGGRWQRDYAALHNDIVAGAQRPRFAVSVAVEAGLADRLIGTFTAFYYALLSGRALQLMTYDTLPPLQAALRPHHVDWVPQHPLSDDIVDPLKYTYLGVRGNPVPRSYPPTVNTSAYWPLYAVNNDSAIDDLLLSGDVATKPAGGAASDTVLLATNRGRVYRLFDNPAHRSWLHDAGLTPETCVACAFHFLFTPRPEVETTFGSTFDALADSHALKIGVAVRAGDHVWAGADSTPWSVAEPYFDCAAQIEATRAAPGQRVVIYFMSDSLSLRQQAHQRYGDKVVTDTVTQYDHPDCRHKDPTACDERRQAAALQHAVGQLLAFSMADYHVYTSASGFGRLGAWLAFGWHHHFAIEGGSMRQCGVGQHDGLGGDAGKWAGI